MCWTSPLMVNRILNFVSGEVQECQLWCYWYHVPSSCKIDLSYGYSSFFLLMEWCLVGFLVALFLLPQSCFIHCKIIKDHIQGYLCLPCTWPLLKVGSSKFLSEYIQFFISAGGQPLCDIPVENILAVERVQESSFKIKNMFQLVQEGRTLYIQVRSCTVLVFLSFMG